MCHQNTCYMTVDGTDFLIQEPKPLDRTFYSHKFKHAALRYEIGISIDKGDIIWVNGPFKAGSYPDSKIFRNNLEKKLRPGECVEADNGYRYHYATVRAPKTYRDVIECGKKARARARHEHVNGLLKNWGIF